MKRIYTIATLSILGGLLLHLAVFMVIRVEGPVSRDPFPRQAPIRFVGDLDGDAAPAVLEQAALNDSAPLFMPTRWNLVSEVSEVASLKEATEIFQTFPAHLQLLETRPTSLDLDQSLPGTAGFRLPEGSAFVLARYGRGEGSVSLPVSIGATYAVTRIDVPRAEVSSVGAGLSPQIGQSAPPSLWNPVQIFLQLNGGMPVGVPMVGQSSGFAAWDATLQDYFSSLEFYVTRSDGYYQIWVYP